MVDGNQILERFVDSFDYATCSQEVPCDYVAYTKIRRDPFYIIIKAPKPSSQELKSIYDQVLSAIRRKLMDIKPVVLFVIEGDELQFGIMVYWDDKKPYLNSNINWRTWSPENLPWFNVQIHARRYQIDYLPLEYLRVMKIIELKDNNTIDGQFVYLRQFTEEYRMSTPPVLNEEERFHRTLCGIPEDEYPKDELDRVIYERIKEQYPFATVKTKLLLFHTDLVNLRQYKECEVKTLSLNLIREHKVNQLADKIKLECYYQPSIFKEEQTVIRDLYPLIVVREDGLYEEMKQEMGTYELISSMNI